MSARTQSESGPLRAADADEEGINGFLWRVQGEPAGVFARMRGVVTGGGIGNATMVYIFQERNECSRPFLCTFNRVFCGHCKYDVLIVTSFIVSSNVRNVLEGLVHATVRSERSAFQVQRLFVNYLM